MHSHMGGGLDAQQTRAGLPPAVGLQCGNRAACKAVGQVSALVIVWRDNAPICIFVCSASCPTTPQCSMRVSQEDTSASGRPVKYVVHRYINGATCHLTGQPRTAEVRTRALARAQACKHVHMRTWHKHTHAHIRTSTHNHHRRTHMHTHASLGQAEAQPKLLAPPVRSFTMHSPYPRLRRCDQVRYTCLRDSKENLIASVREFPTCNYVVLVSTPLLCQHPAFRPKARGRALLGPGGRRRAACSRLGAVCELAEHVKTLCCCSLVFAWRRYFPLCHHHMLTRRHLATAPMPACAARGLAPDFVRPAGGRRAGASRGGGV
jgi:hypothetical protein